MRAGSKSTHKSQIKVGEIEKIETITNREFVIQTCYNQIIPSYAMLLSFMLIQILTFQDSKHFQTLSSILMPLNHSIVIIRSPRAILVDLRQSPFLIELFFLRCSTWIKVWLLGCGRDSDSMASVRHKSITGTMVG